MWTKANTDGVQQGDLVQDLLHDALDHRFVEEVLLRAQETHHVAGLGLVLHQDHGVDGLQHLNQGRDVELLQLVEVPDFVLHQLDS